MDTQASAPDGKQPVDPGSTVPNGADGENRRSDSDRRTEDRRRSAKGLFEKRARRDRSAADRRQTQRRSNSRFKLTFWRRSNAQ